MTFVNLLDIIYPVGSIYFSYKNTSPAEIIGGSWTQINGYFIRGANDVSIGGSNTHRLTINEMPSHTHDIYGWEWLSGSTYKAMSAQSSVNYAKTTTATGGGKAHNNMPLYQDLYIWRRTA